MTTPTDHSTPIPRPVSPAQDGPATSYLGRPCGRIGYDVAGLGPLVMLVPGMGDLRAAYRFLAPALRTAGYRVAWGQARTRGPARPGHAGRAPHRAGGSA